MIQNEEMAVRVALVDDHPVFREGLRALAQLEPDLDVVGEANDAREAYRMAEEHRPDVMTIDVGLPGADGIAATRELVRRLPELRVLVLSMHAGEDWVAAALSAGATGYALKTQPPEEVFGAIRDVARGRRYLAPTISAERVDDQLARHAEGRDPLAPLSRREREIFDLLVRGFSSQEVADELCISVKTVETHRVHIHRKLGVHSVAELIHYAAVRGLLRP
jgi:DNA-binding NarL/FixJ family response regulator